MVIGDLSPYRVRARNSGAYSENKIHDDDMARRLGFRGGLVPGVTLYAYMTHPVVAALGREWLERGTVSVHFRRPVYHDDVVTVRANVSAHTESLIRLEVAALNSAGERCAVGTAALDGESRSTVPELAAYSEAPPPAVRPPATRKLLAGLTVLGSPKLAGEEAQALAYLDTVDETLPLYRERNAPAHPGLLVRQANRALDLNVLTGPWIHVASDIEHLALWRAGEPLSTRGRVAGLWEKNGHEYVELDLLMVAGTDRPVAHVRHRCIYKVAEKGLSV